MEEMDKFLEKYNFPKLNQEEIENLNSSITSTEIETVIGNLTKQGRNKCKRNKRDHSRSQQSQKLVL